MTLLRGLLATLLLVAVTGCDDTGSERGFEPTGTLAEVTPEALAGIAAQHVDLDLERVGKDPRTERTPCGPAYRQVYAAADFAGATLHMSMELGTCPEQDITDYVCGPPPPGTNHASTLRKCDRLELSGGRVVDSGVEVAYQEGRYHVAVLYSGDLQLTLTTRTDEPAPISLDTLVALASDPAIGDRVDAAYAEVAGGAEVSPSAAARVPVTGAAMIAIAEEHLDATATAVETERIRPPECPSSYVRLLAQGTFDGRRLGVDLEFGECPRGDHAHFVCGRFPDLPGRGVKLDACTRRTLEDGSSLVTGRHDVYQESSSLLAAMTAPDYVVVVITSAVPVPEFTVEELADVATATELGPRVDPAYTAAP